MSKKRKNNKKRRIRIFRLLLVLGILACIVFGFYKIITLLIPNNSIPTSKDIHYAGTGKVYTNKKDGYTSTFTTDELYKKTYKEFKQNQNTPWASKPYWGRNNGQKWMWYHRYCNNSKWI